MDSKVLSQQRGRHPVGPVVNTLALAYCVDVLACNSVTWVTYMIPTVLFLFTGWQGGGCGACPGLRLLPHCPLAFANNEGVISVAGTAR